jgi:2-amino-4-hydroxy-6-hydroxymethyldihydropteridine diphosphokinase
MRVSKGNVMKAIIMSTVYIGIGSNIGNREKNCIHAIQLLKENGIAVKKQSSMYETEPWGIKDQPKFINMAIEVETKKEPEELLTVLKCIEKTIGREDAICCSEPTAYRLLPTAQRWGPRIIDLDILFYDDLILDRAGLKIPHPFMHEREFVLKPLAEIAPDKKHPIIKKTVMEMLNEISKNK